MLSRSVFLVLRHIQAWRDPCGTLSRIQVSGNHSRKVKEVENWRVCSILNWKGKEFCPNKELFMISLKRKLIMLFQENLQLRQEWQMRDADIALYETGMQLQSQRMESID